MSRAAPILPSGRIEGLDAWRSGLMVAGVFLHGSSWLDNRPLFEVLALFSHTFRMGAFFAISGFLAARALATRSPWRWLSRRLFQIGVPTLFGLTVLCPLVTVIVAMLPGEHSLLRYNWYHLWFLVALLLYAPLAMLADEIDRIWGLWRVLGRHFGRDGATPMRLFAVTGLLCCMCLLGSSIAIGAVGTPATMPFLSGCRSIASYWPDWLFGFAVARSQELRSVLLRHWRSPAVVLGTISLTYAVWFLLLGPLCAPATQVWGNGLLPLLGEAIAPPATFALILRLSVRVRRLAPPMRMLADASFTIYITHVPVIAALTLTMADTSLVTEGKYALIVLLTLPLTLAFHHLCVRRSAWLSLIFCGKMPALAPRAPTHVPSLVAMGRR